MASLHWLSLTEMRAAMARGECTADDVWHACQTQIARHDPALHAWQELASTQPPMEGAATDGPLGGLPIGVKDTIDVKGFRAERGSAVWQGHQPQADAACVSALKSLGARVLGKTVTTEFAYFKPGATANPHALTHTPGGSSSGSAAAVAAGMVPLALGSQTAASVIRPAAFCGVIGYVATAGRHALRGVMPLAHTLDALGLFAREVADVQYALACLAHEPLKTLPAPRRLRSVLVVDGQAFGVLDPEMQAVHIRAVQALVQLGVDVTHGDVELLGRDGGQGWADAHRQLMAAQAAQTLAYEYCEHAQALSPPLRALIEEGLHIDAAEYDALCARQDEARWRFSQGMRAYDAVLAPAATGPAPEGLGATGCPSQSRAWQWLGVPQVTLPAGFNAQGLPLGLQLIGARHGDRDLLQQAHWLQDELDWRWRIPKPMD